MHSWRHEARANITTLVRECAILLGSISAASGVAGSFFFFQKGGGYICACICANTQVLKKIGGFETTPVAATKALSEQAFLSVCWNSGPSKFSVNSCRRTRTWHVLCPIFQALSSRRSSFLATANAGPGRKSVTLWLKAADSIGLRTCDPKNIAWGSTPQMRFAFALHEF